MKGVGGGRSIECMHERIIAKYKAKEQERKHVRERDRKTGS